MSNSFRTVFWYSWFLEYIYIGSYSVIKKKKNYIAYRSRLLINFKYTNNIYKTKL